MKKLMIEMLIIIVFVALFGGWALQEWRKRHPRLIGYNARFTHNFSPAKQVKVYQGKWHRDYLEIIK